MQSRESLKTTKNSASESKLAASASQGHSNRSCSITNTPSSSGLHGYYTRQQGHFNVVRKLLLLAVMIRFTAKWKDM